MDRKVYWFDKDKKFFEIQNHEIKTVIGFGQKYKGRFFDEAFKDLDWLFFCLESRYISIPLFFLIKMRNNFKAFSKYEEEYMSEYWIRKMKNPEISDSDYLTEKLKSKAPVLLNTYWEDIFITNIGFFKKGLLPRVESILSNTVDYEKKFWSKNLRNQYNIEVIISVMLFSYPNLSKLLSVNDISHSFTCGNWDKSLKINPTKLSLSFFENFPVRKVKKLIDLLDTDVFEIKVNYRSSSRCIISPFILKDKKIVDDYLDVSKEYKLSEFKDILKGMISAKITDYHQFFPNIKPSMEWEYYRLPVEERDYEPYFDDEDSRKEAIEMANKHFYDQFGAFFHEDML